MQLPVDQMIHVLAICHRSVVSLMLCFAMLDDGGITSPMLVFWGSSVLCQKESRAHLVFVDARCFKGSLPQARVAGDEHPAETVDFRLDYKAPRLTVAEIWKPKEESAFVYGCGSAVYLVLFDNYTMLVAGVQYVRTKLVKLGSDTALV